MLNQSRKCVYLIWGALIGALFLWGSLIVGLGSSPTLGWVADQPGVFFVLVFVAPVLEEYVFRRLVYDYVAERNHWAWPKEAVFHISAANLVSSLLFVAMHIGFRGLTSGLMVILPSLYLGLIRRESFGLAPCILVHGIWNLGWFSLFTP